MILPLRWSAGLYHDGAVRRGESRLKEMTVDGGRYALMIALPLLLGMAA